MATSRGAENYLASYFLDTSTQIGRRWADEDKGQQIRDDLSARKLHCSIYVERQYRCRVLNALITLHAFVTSSDDIQEAEKRLEKCKREISLDDIVYNVGRRLLKKYKRKKPLLSYLRRLIEVDWKNLFYDAISKPLCDMTNCSRGVDSPAYERGYYFTIPTKCTRNCKISDFCKLKQEDLQNLAAVDTAVLNRVSDPKGTMKEIQAEAETVLGGKSPHYDSCAKLSDAIISIEARDSYPGITIHTMDYDFELLKKILNTNVDGSVKSRNLTHQSAILNGNRGP